MTASSRRPGRKPTAVATRLAAMLRPTPSGCLEFTGTRRDGYGRIRMSDPKRMEDAHRVAFVLAFGPIADDVMVLHDCDNRACCNSAHLRLGSHFAKALLMVSRSRHGMQRERTT